MKAVRGAEISHDTLDDKEFAQLSNASVYDRLSVCDDKRIFCVYEALKRGITVEQIHEVTLIDEWFLEKLKNIIAVENELKNSELTDDLYYRAEKMGFLNRTIEAITGKKCEKNLCLYIKWLIPAPLNLRHRHLTSTLPLIRKTRQKSLLKIINQIKRQLLYSVQALSESVRVSNLTMRRFTAYGHLKRQAMMLLS